MITLVLPEDIGAWWSEIADQLAPAILVDPKRKIADVQRELLSGALALFQINQKSVNALAVVSIVETKDAKAFSLIYLSGKIGHVAPRRFIATIQDLMNVAIKTAKDLHCTEMRLEGRDWRRVFPDWDWQDERNQLTLKV